MVNNHSTDIVRTRRYVFQSFLTLMYIYDFQKKLGNNGIETDYH
jgi:hypothetical protein